MIIVIELVEVVVTMLVEVAVVLVVVEVEVVVVMEVALVIDVLINVVFAVEITLEFATSVSCSVYVLYDGAVDLLANALAVLTVVIISGLSGIDVDVLVEVNVNMFAGVMTEVKFVMSASLEGFRN